MTGRESSEFASAAAPADVGSIVLSAQGLTNAALRDISFDLHKGEILGFAGLAGSGLEHLTRLLIFGGQTGRILLEGQPWRGQAPAGAWGRGIASIPRERRAEGLLPTQDIASNVALPHLGWLNRWGFMLDRRTERSRTDEMRRRVRLKSTGPRQKVLELSGGNQQKVMFARAVAGNPRVLLLDEPTRGVDGIVIPNLTLVAIAVLILIWTFLEQTIYGRRLYAIGGNAEAARLAGVRVKHLRFVAFGISGVGAAAAGLMLASRVASANPTQGAGLMLDAIAAVFLGMTMSDEGQPRVLFTLIGVLMLGVLGNGLTQMNVDSYVREMITGSIIIVAVAIGSLGRTGAG